MAYAGYPLHDLNGHPVGSLCAIDARPREWTEQELAVLEDLALACTSEVQLREANATAATRRRPRHPARGARADPARPVRRLHPDPHARTTCSTRCSAPPPRSPARPAASIALVLPERSTLAWVRHAVVEGAPPNLWDEDPLSRTESPAVQAVVTGGPLFFDDGDAMGTAFPLVAGVGGPGAAAFLPLTTATATLGVVLLRWTEPRALDDEVRDLLVTLASDASTAVERAQLLQSRADVARTLQAAMLSHLPAPAGVALDAVYLPAEATEEVGGDWYDAMELADGGFAIVVGDVTGHDMPAATRMGQLRSMLRALLWEHDKPPSLVLELLDQANVGTGLEATATAFLARLEPPTASGARRLTWTSAGHPPALVRRADGACLALDARPDLPLGFVPARERHDHVVVLAPQDTVVVYTDGLLERRTESLRTSIDRGVSVVAGLATLDAQAVVDALGPTDDRRDDVVVLTLRLN